MGLYIISSLHNRERVRHLRDIFATHQITLTYDWTVHGKVTDQALLPSIAASEIKGVKTADCILFVWPGRYGSHFELGLAFGLQKPIVMLLDNYTNDDTVSFHTCPELFRTYNENDAITNVLEILKGRHAAVAYIMDDCHE